MNTVINTNMAAIRTHGVYNRNNTAMNAAMTRVATGLKINSAQDNASGYAITEKMRERIRSLDQVNQNTQNDTAMLKTAEGGIANTVSILRTLKERALDAANDSNNNDDRAKIQNEVSELIKQIDQNADVTYNGKKLIDGSAIATYDSKSAYLNTTVTSLSTTLASLDGTLTDGGSYRLSYTRIDANGNPEAVTKDGTITLASTTIGDVLNEGSADFSATEVAAGTTITTNEENKNVSASAAGIAIVAQNAGTAGAITGITITTAANTASLASAAPNGNFGTFTPVNTAADGASGNALSFQIGEDLSLEVSLGNMKSAALGIGSINLATKAGAKASISLIDDALNNALNEQTKVGALESRLGYASDNIVTARENVEASASTIADSDIAKEMTNYMKFAVLSQASQYMLAQAGQNAFSVLNLLQA